MTRLAAVVLFVLALVAAACGSGGDDGDTAAEPSDADATSEGSADDGEAPDVTTSAEDDEDAAPAQEADLPDYQAEAAQLPQATRDSELPPLDPEAPIGAVGYSRYVYSEVDDQVIPVLLEGPRGFQVRCQDEDKQCSYRELKALYESGDEVPDYLQMDRETLGELVAQLDRVNAAVMQYDDINDACAKGFSKSTNQVPNMGIHMIDNYSGPFDVDRPQMILFAKDGGGGEGNCVGGAWTGEDGFVPVGAVFNIPLGDGSHPDGFAGQLDNWHIHYNTCVGADNGTATTQERCREAGGQFLSVIPNWMMHAYVADDYDAQSGVFSMYNPTIHPVVSTDQLVEERVVDQADVEDAPIINFDFGDISVGVGETIRFSNSDSVPHTVTAGSNDAPRDDFDSGLLGTGQVFDVAFDSPGEYALFCVLHPDMTATIVVE